MIHAGRGQGSEPDPAGNPAPAGTGDPAPGAAGPAPAGTGARASGGSAGTPPAASAAEAARQGERAVPAGAVLEADPPASGSAGAAGGQSPGGRSRHWARNVAGGVGRVPRRALARSGAATRRAFGHPWVRHVALLLCYTGAGIAVTWPRASYLPDGRLPRTPDVSSYVWDLWWVAHQLQHPGNPFFTRYMAAPAGMWLGFSTLIPLAGWLTAPITVLYGPSASFSLLAIVTPGLLCYAMFRAARLWLNWAGAVVAGAFFGLSSMLVWQDWYHLNIALGSVFLPLTIEAAVRFRRNSAAAAAAAAGPREAGPREARPGRATAAAVALGLALGGSILVNQESTVAALAIAAVIVVPSLVARLARNRAGLSRVLVPLGIGAAVGLVVAAPELVAMGQQIAAGGASPPPGPLAANYAEFGVTLPTMFAPSPRLAAFGLGSLASAYSYNQPAEAAEAVPTFGAVLTALALLGLLAGWRRRATWAFLGLWAAGAVLALGTSLTIGANCQISAWRAPGTMWGRSCHQYLPLLTHLHATKVVPPSGPPGYRPVVASDLMPYTWLVRVPGLAGLREADRFTIPALVGAALLAGLAVQWLSRRKVTMPLIAVVVGLGALEAGWNGAGVATMPTALPAVDHLLAHDHSGSIVVDVPFGLRGGVGTTGSPIAPNALVLATRDGHPRAIAYTAWVPAPTSQRMYAHPFFRVLTDIELLGQGATPAQVRLARADLAHLDVGWVVEWRDIWRLHRPIARYGHVDDFLRATGFTLAGRACLVRVRSMRECPSHPSEQVWIWRYSRS